MKNRFVKKACCGLFAFSLPAFAANVQISNANFDVQDIADNNASSVVQNWMMEYGLEGVFNPPGSAFIGEAGNGSRKNTLYLIDDAQVYQSLSTSVLPNTEYRLQFEVGERSNVEFANYTVTIKAGGSEVFSVNNPVLLQNPGEFAKADLVFNTDSRASGLLAIEVRTAGTGHANFDNFTLSYSQSGKSFGEWQHTHQGTPFSVNVEYLAESDGFITHFTTNNCQGNRSFLNITNKDGSRFSTQRSWDNDSMMSPVKKGQKWKINRYKAISTCQAHIRFIPLQ